MLAQKVPVVLYEDVYAMASVLGGIVICVLYPLTGIVYASWGRIWRGSSSPHLRDPFRVETLSSRKDARQRKRIAGIEAGKVLR